MHVLSLTEYSARWLSVNFKIISFERLKEGIAVEFSGEIFKESFVKYSKLAGIRIEEKEDHLIINKSDLQCEVLSEYEEYKYDIFVSSIV